MHLYIACTVAFAAQVTFKTFNVELLKFHNCTFSQLQKLEAKNVISLFLSFQNYTSDFLLTSTLSKINLFSQLRFMILV